MLYQHRVVTLFIFLLSLLHLSYTSSRCSSRYCWSNWSGWTRSNTETRYRRSYCSADSIYCREGRDVSATRCPDRDYQDIVGDVETPIKKSDQELFAERLTRNENPDIQFSSEDARYMSARMISTLDYMVNELPQGFTLVIVGGYQDIEKGNASFPLQYEGRGVLLSTTYRRSTAYDTSYLLCITYKAALSAGFDWLEYTGVAGNYIKAAVGNEECSKVLDIAFMIDSSGSLDTSDFNRALDFVKTIVYGLTINSDGSGSRVAALSYSKQVDLGFDLNDYYDKGSIIKEIGKLTYFGSGTYTHLGLRTLATKVFQTTYGARSTQEGIPRIAFILTDGRASLAFEQDAENLKDLDVNVYAVGIGDGIDITELKQIASSPADQYVSTIDNYYSTSSLVSESLTKICNTQAKIIAGQQTSGSCNRDETRFYQLECPFLSSSINVELVESTGRCSLYASDRVVNPSTYYKSSDVVRDETTTGVTRRCSLSLKNTNRAYIGIRGRTNQNSYRVIVWEKLFSRGSVEVTLPDGISIGSPVTTVSTDFSDSYNFQYSILSQQEYFSIHSSSGQITLIKAIDRSNKFYNLSIGAQERSQNCRRGRVNVIIKVSQATNTHAPLFVNPPSKITIPETTAIHSEIFAFSINDYDEGDNGEFYVEIVSQSRSYFKVTQNGQLKVAHQLNASVHTEDLLKVKATDRGDPPRSSVHELLVIVVDVNEHPIFIKSCAQQYFCTLSIPESDSSNYNVPDGKFTAHDYDLGNNGVLEYSVVSEGAPFDINSATGQLYVTYSIDRESKDEYILSILCRDKGNPPLTAGTRVKVVITDVNDETPIFSNSIFFFSVLESSPDGTVCGRIAATDNDLGKNSEIYYEISSIDLFTIDNTGRVILRGSLDREVESKHQLTVMAVDKGDRPLTGNAQIVVTVLDVNDNQPVFSTSTYVLNLWETTAVSTQVIKVIATDKDIGINAIITYSIYDGDFESIFSIVPNTGQIILSSSVDAERVISYNLTLKANDNGISALEAYASLFITILDANDNAPIFARDYSFSVFEDASIGHLVGQVSATDGDVSSQTITYTLQDDVFKIEESTGEIFVNATLDYSSTSVHNLSITAKDNGKPQLSTIIYVIVSVFEIDAKISTFSESYYEISIPEDTAVSTRIAQYVPVNPDGSPFVTDFELSQGNLSFTINSQGIISVTKELDYESTAQHELTIVRLADMVTARLLINVTDVNDNAPVLSGYNNRYEISEDAMVGQELFVVTATDADSDVLTNISFSLTIFPRITHFEINPQSGQVTVTGILDYESVKQYWLRIAVTDGGLPISLQSYNFVAVIVSDVNDNSPVFSPLTYTAVVTEGITPPHLITTVYARDADSGSNAMITYSFDSQSQAFSGCKLDYDPSSNFISITNKEGHLTYQHDGIDPLPLVLMTKLMENCSSTSSLPSNTIAIDPNTGSVTTAIALDFETYSVFFLKVIGEDNGVIKRKGVGSVLVQVEDINDSPPVFHPDQISISIPENTTPDATIHSITVTDADQLGLSVPQLTLTTNPSNLPFTLAGKVIKLTEYIDADAGFSTVTISVAASDGRYSANLAISVNIENINDNSPVFLSDYHRNISEYARPGAVFTCQAVDNDISSFGVLEYSILSGNSDGIFAIDPLTGVVTMVKGLDYESHPSFVLIIQATDGGGLSATTTGTIYVINENDNAPELQPPFTVTISDVLVIKILSLTVIDRDTPQPQVIFSQETEVFASNGTYTFMVKAIDSLNHTLYSTASVFIVITYPCAHVDFFLDKSTGVITMYTLCSVSLSVPAQVTAHSDVIFECNAVSNSDLEYCWKYEGRSRGCNAALNDNALVLYDVTARESGRYACQVTNLAKRRLISFPETVISVHGKADVIGPSNLTAITKTTIELKCEIISSLTYSSKWYHNNTLLHNDSRITSYDDTLEISIVTALDAGDYYCVVTNAAGTTTSTRGWLNVCDCQEPFDGDFTFSLPRDVAANSLVGSVESTYQQYFNYHYYIVSSNVNDTFVISKLDGRIYIIRSILADAVTAYSLVIYAADITGTYSGETRVTITVEQRNFYSPKITNIVDSISIVETISVSQTILTLITDDKDFGKDGEVTVTLTRSTDANYFKLQLSESNTWHLVTDDRFNATKKGQFFIKLVATDGGNPPMSSIYDLTVFIEDVNSPPQFVATCASHSTCSYTVEEDTSVTSKVASIKAYDTDIGSNAKLIYKIDTARLPFYITTNGELILKSKLDYEAIIAYVFDVIAQDGGNPSLYSKTKVTVNVVDSNDNVPVFLQDVYQFSVSESLPPHQPFGLITATDRDSGSNGVIDYYVDHIALEFKFIFDSNGHLEVLTAFDYEDTRMYNFTVLAVDKGNPSLTATATILVYILDENDNTPVFSQSLYQSNISECSSVGDEVTVLQATDADHSQTQLYYSIPIQNRLMEFAVDSTTGQISLFSNLDAESIIFYQFTVEVRDSLDITAKKSIATVQINIINCNDNPPMFVKDFYNFTILSSASAGHAIGHVYAVDNDNNDTDVITYSILNGNINNVFRMNPVTGQLVVNNLTAAFGRNYFVLNVQANDDGYPTPLYDQTEVIVNLIDASSTLVQFFQHNLTITISEITDPSTSLAKFDFKTAFQYFSTNQLTRLEIVSQNNNGTFALDGSSGIFSLNKELINSGIQSYVLFIESEYNGRVVAMSITVNVTDINDHSPQFVPPGPYSVNIDEDLAPGTIVFNATALDADSGENARITYSITVNPSAYSNDFVIDSVTGELKIARNLSFTAVPFYTIQIFATDHGIPSFTTGTSLQLRINDVDNFIPQFSSSLYNVSVSEAIVDGSIVLILSATDEDANAIILYRTVPGSLMAYKHNALVATSTSFDVERDTGFITLQGGLDFERETRYEFQVAAYNDEASQVASTATVLIYVTDINDVPPRFNVSSYSVTISETIPIGTPLVQLDAYDEDTFAMLTFSLLFNNQMAPIQVDINTGVVSTNGEVDYERIRFFSATATVFDGIFQGQVTLFFEIENINDHFPIFATRECIGNLREDALPPLSIVPCVASDNDDGEFGELTYSITSGNFDNKFIITSFTGVLSLNKPLDFEERSNYVLEITVSDGGNKSATATAFITVINVNDNPPQISGDLSYTITDDTQIKIAKLTAIDKDLSDGTVPYVSYTYLENSLRFDCRTDTYSFIIRIADINDANARSDSEFFIQLKYPCEIVIFAVEEYTGILSIYTLCSVELFPIAEGKLGGNVTLRAAAKGNTVWTYCWKFNRVTVSCTGQTSYVHLYKLQTANEGRYSAEVTNIAGTLTSSSQQLRVFVPPTILPLKSVTAVQGSSVTLTCTVISERQSDFTIVWYFEGKELAFSQQTSKNGSVWTIRSVQFSDEGFYSCKVTIPGFGTEVTSQPAKVTIFRQNAVIDISLLINTYSYVDFCFEYDITQIMAIIRRATHYNPVLLSDTPSGRLCQSSVCYPNPCQNGAQCIIQNDNDFSCECLPGWTGRVCDSPVDYCRDFPPCLFQGTCVALNTTINNFRCACPAGYTGLFCELFTDVCVANSCDENTRCVLSQYTQTHFTCVTTPYIIQIKRDVILNELLFGTNQQWNLQSSDSVYQLEIFLRHFIQNIEIPEDFVNKSTNRIFNNRIPCNVLLVNNQGSSISFDLICPPDYPALNSEEKEAICYQLLYSGYFESCIPPDQEIIENVIPNSLSNVTFYMEDDSGAPLSADDIIPVLTEEVALSPNPGNPYYLIQVDKAPEPVTKDGSPVTTSSQVEEASSFPAWGGALMGVATILILLIIVVSIVLCIICCPCCTCCPCNRKRKLLIEKRYIISNLSAATSDMTLNSTLPQAESAFQIYDNVGPVRRPSQLAEIGEETMMWLNRDNENPYVYDLGENETLSEPTNKEETVQNNMLKGKKISTISTTPSSLADETLQSTTSLIKGEFQPSGQKKISAPPGAMSLMNNESQPIRPQKISTVSMGGAVVTTQNPLFGKKLNQTKWNAVGDGDELTEGTVDNQSYGLPLQNIQQDKNKKPLEKQVTIESMESTFLTEIDETEMSYKQVTQSMTPLDFDEDSDILDPWYFGNMSRVEAEEKLLAHGKVGGYLVRNANTIPGDVCLSILAAKPNNNEPAKFHHLLVSLNSQDQYYIKSLPEDKISFPSLPELTAYYSVTNINFNGFSAPLMLTEPCPKHV